jgi:hypothetical protein
MATSAWRKSSKEGGGVGKVKLFSFLGRRRKSYANLVGETEKD